MGGGSMIRILECCICNRMARANLLLRGRNICSRCEQGMVKIQTDDGDYIWYQEGIKRLFRAVKEA